MAKISNPFATVPFTPRAFQGGSPLAEIARNFAPRITVTNAEEQTRAAVLTADVAAGNAPTFTSTPTRPPYEPVTPVAHAPEPKAGGSKT